MAVKYTPYRWLILVLFSIANALTSVHWMLFSPIVSKVLIAYAPDATDNNINMMAMSYFIMISIDNPLCAWISEKWGLRVTVLISCFFMTVGGLIKSFMNDSFALLLVGQFIIATVFPMIYINSAKVSANWFPENERVMTTMIGMQSSVLGSSISFLLPGLFVSKTDDVKILRDQITTMLDYVWIFQTVHFLCLLIFFKEKAGQDDSVAIEDQPVEVEDKKDIQEALIPVEPEVPVVKPEFSLKQQYKDLLTNKNYNFMCLSISCMVSEIFMILTLMSEVLVPFGYTDHDVSSFGFWGNLIGIVGGIVAAIIITKTDKYKMTSVGLIIGTIVGTTGFQLSATYLSRDTGYWLTFICLLIVCFSNMGIQAYCLEYAVYLAPEIGEAISGGTVCQVFNIFAFVQLQVLEACFKGIKNPKSKMRIMMIFNYVLLALALVFILLTKKDERTEDCHDEHHHHLKHREGCEDEHHHLEHKDDGHEMVDLGKQKKDANKIE